MKISPCLAAALVMIVATGASAQTQQEPVAKRGGTVDSDFGLKMPDPYRWMEGEKNAEFDAWLKAQGAASRAKLDALPTLETW
ncbi:MAG: hypothetical protein ABJA62_10465, partial [Luteimonas sp.]